MSENKVAAQKASKYADEVRVGYRKLTRRLEDDAKRLIGEAYFQGYLQGQKDYYVEVTDGQNPLPQPPKEEV